MKKVIKCESLAVAILCLEKIIDTAMDSQDDLATNGISLKTVGSMMDDHNSLASILKECKESSCDKFVILPVSDAQA